MGRPGRRFCGWALPFLVSFAVYEMTLLGAAALLGGFETFKPAIVAQIGFINAVSLAGMVVLNEVAAALCRPWWDGYRA